MASRTTTKGIREMEAEFARWEKHHKSVARRINRMLDKASKQIKLNLTIAKNRPVGEDK